MATIKGQNLRLFLGNGDSAPIAAALSCDLNVQLNVQQYSTKDDEGSWMKNLAVALAWSVKASGVVSNDPDRNDTPSLMARRGQVVYVRLALASGEKNSDMGDVLIAGEAILSDIQVTAQNRQRGTFDVTLTGMKNMLFDIRALVTSDAHYLRTSDGHILCAYHEQ